MDRRASEVVHASGLYPQAVFALQQAVEKTVKAIGLSTRVITVGELHGAISHKAINVFLLALRKISAFGRARGADRSAMDKLDELLHAGENARSRFANASMPTAGELTKWIDDYRELRHNLQDIHATPAGAQMVEAVKESLTEPIPFDAAEIPRRIFEALTTIAGLYALSLATLGHAVTSRYGEGERSPIEMYGAAHPLVARLSDLNDVARECIGFTRSTYEFWMSFP